MPGFGKADLESDSCSPQRRRLSSLRRTLLLAYQSIGVVYGDLSISPIYVYSTTFAGKMRFHKEDTEIMGIFSLAFWTLNLIVLCKYIIIVLGADDNGEGGTFALYSKLCSKSRIGLINNQFRAHNCLSLDESEASCKGTVTGSMIKSFFEKYQKSRVVLFFVVLLGSSMLIGDGVLTPTMSVLSAASGIRIKAPELHEKYTLYVACIILVGLFALQHYGTHRIGFLFAPVLIAWLGCICVIGMYNTLKWNPLVVQALSPFYIYKLFKDTGKDSWSSLGGVVLCITGAEAMFADLGHFSKLSLRMAFTMLVYPSIVIAYMGEAAYLSKHHEDLQMSFYRSIPDRLFWPVFVIATLATIIGSQATISATFSIIGQCRALSCFPRVKIIHTSNNVYGQIYIPEVNWLLLVLCLTITICFRDTTLIGNAYGLAVITVMFITTCLMFLIITIVWKRSVFLALLFTTCFGCVELLYLSACVAKVPHGGWIPLAISMTMLLVMAIWHYGTSTKRAYELHSKVNMDDLFSFSTSLGVVPVSGIGLIYSSTPDGLPPIFSHFITNFPAFHRIIIFVNLQTVPIPKFPPEKRFFIDRVGSGEYLFFRCVVRYGYKDASRDVYDFEDQLFAKVAEFLQRGSGNSECKLPLMDHPSELQTGVVAVAEDSNEEEKRNQGIKGFDRLNAELNELFEQREAGVTYLIGKTSVVAHESSSFFKRIAINHFYGFLRRNCRQPAVGLGIPHASLIEVGMVYRV